MREPVPGQRAIPRRRAGWRIHRGLGQISTRIDEDTLKAVATTTGGSYYSAESASDLQSVFAKLPTSLILKHEVVELSVGFVGAGALLRFWLCCSPGSGGRFPDGEHADSRAANLAPYLPYEMPRTLSSPSRTRSSPYSNSSA